MKVYKINGVEHVYLNNKKWTQFNLWELETDEHGRKFWMRDSSPRVEGHLKTDKGIFNRLIKDDRIECDSKLEII